MCTEPKKNLKGSRNLTTLATGTGTDTDPARKRIRLQSNPIQSNLFSVFPEASLIVAVRRQNEIIS
jgi:hypothetical protein